MTRPKTVRELRQEIVQSEMLRTKSQVEISRALRINQATVSRILRGQFKRRSAAVNRVCKYARISCITDSPLPELEASLEQLSVIAAGSTPAERQAMKLIRLAAELLEIGPISK